MRTSNANSIVLISDDSQMDRELRNALQTTAPNIVFGVVQSREELESLHTPKIILLDLMLSRERPFDLLRWLRSQSRFQRIAIFALGSEVLKQDVHQAYHLGANSCLQRTTQTEELKEIARGLAGYASLIAA